MDREGSHPSDPVQPDFSHPKERIGAFMDLWREAGVGDAFNPSAPAFAKSLHRLVRQKGYLSN